MNRMADVAALFGKEIGEEFTVKRGQSIVKVEFNLEGLWITTKNITNSISSGKVKCCVGWLDDGVVLHDLLTGEAVIAND